MKTLSNSFEVFTVWDIIIREFEGLAPGQAETNIAGRCLSIRKLKQPRRQRQRERGKTIGFN